MKLNKTMETLWLTMDSKLDAWDEFVDRSPQGCLFCKSWWLRASCGDDCRIAVVLNGDNIVAGIPLYSSRSGIISMPMLTQTLGVLFDDLQGSMSVLELQSYEELVLKLLIDMMSVYSLITFKCHYNFTNWTPLHWGGYRQTTYYTFVINDLDDLDKVYAGFDVKKKRSIKKALRLIDVKMDMEPECFYDEHRRSLQTNEVKIDYSCQQLMAIYSAGKREAFASCIYAVDSEDNVHSGALVVGDQKATYLLTTFNHAEFKSSRALSAVIWNAICQSSKISMRFDFMGSMIDGVEQSHRRFGGQRMPYSCIYRDNRSIVSRAVSYAYNRFRKDL